MTEDALESKLARIEERVKRRQERAGAEQTILVAQLASRLQRQVQWLNSTFTSENSGLVTSVQGSLSQKVAVLDKTLAFVRRDSLAKLTAQKVALAALDKEQKDAVQVRDLLALLAVMIYKSGDKEQEDAVQVTSCTCLTCYTGTKVVLRLLA